MCAIAPTRAIHCAMFSRLNENPTRSAVASMRSSTEAGSVSPGVELSLDDHKVTNGSIGCSRDGTTFAFTIGPLSDATMAALESAAELQGQVCLYCCREPMLINLVDLTRQGPRIVRIVGRVVDQASLESGPGWGAKSSGPK
jgi:hypothetical protein